MSLIAKAHGALVFDRRVRVLAGHLAPLLPQSASVLDVGCGDGSIARAILEQRGDLALSGVDVLVRPKTHTPVEPYDGKRLPRPDASIDAVMFVDVLHHTDDPAILLAEARRVARRCIVIKDHLRDGILAGPTLRLMDWVGNAPHGVALPYNYWPESRWRATLAALGLTATSWHTRLGLYPFPAGLAFDRGLHFVARLERN
jgi:SAM-dependent methyltransferase